MELNFAKYADGLIPAIVQDADTRVVLMLGFMNKEAFDKTMATKKVTFYSRSRQTLWTKGETSGNFLNLVDIKIDCDNDTLLVKAHPIGPTCHKGTDTCWAEDNKGISLSVLQEKIARELQELPSDSDLTKLLNKGGANKLAQEVGENALETIIQVTNGSQEKLTEKSADLLFHLLALLAKQNVSVETVLEQVNQRIK
ncbi:MAG: bifunctional phosphoribosyl-AMP cyclohydrolase/phosphoribosyl-ATP diphosphatase HisIE [Bacteroidales bacterium]|nr:bifunctional phosphoribosyl-AMP cyclohydrolase/phosphoribosyl-ATP diphosphatase HisIE [Bacteroidales bacterium]